MNTAGEKAYEYTVATRMWPTIKNITKVLKWLGVKSTWAQRRPRILVPKNEMW